MIGEYGAEQSDPAAKAAWIAGATAYAQAHPQIKAMVYFDADRVDDHGVQRDFRVDLRPDGPAGLPGDARQPLVRAQLTSQDLGP